MEKKWNWTKIMKNYQKLEKWWKWENWNEAVWDAKMIVMKPEKKFWAAQIELYRWVMSNDPYGHKKIAKMVIMFSDFGPQYWRRVVDCHIFHVLGARMALKNKNRCSKIIFCQNFHQKQFFLNTTFFILASNFEFFRFCFQNSISLHFWSLLH